MSPLFQHRSGELPLLISMPHDGRDIPDDIRERMSDAGRAIPDTDWDVVKLYEFAAEMDANTVVANYSRYVVDLNRPADDKALYAGQVATGLCPEQTFAGVAIYRDGGVEADEKKQRIEEYWRPYHDYIRDTLDALRAKHGFALLWDAHSIPSVVPRLFDGELAELNLGSNGNLSCARVIQDAVSTIATESCHSAEVNGRFKGGFITRNYGDPHNDIHALQMEIAQRAYMDEETTSFDPARATLLRDTLQKMLNAFLDAAQK